MTDEEKIIERVRHQLKVFTHPSFDRDAVEILLAKYDLLEEAITEIAWMRPAGDLPKMIDSSLVERMEKIAIAALEGHFATHEQRYGVPEPTGEGGELDVDHGVGPVVENIGNERSA